MDIGQQIARARKDANLTQGELAARGPWTQARISAYETGAMTPSPETVRALAEALGKRVDVVIAPDDTHTVLWRGTQKIGRPVPGTFAWIEPGRRCRFRVPDQHGDGMWLAARGYLKDGDAWYRIQHAESEGPSWFVAVVRPALHPVRICLDERRAGIGVFAEFSDGRHTAAALPVFEKEGVLVDWNTPGAVFTGMYQYSVGGHLKLYESPNEEVLSHPFFLRAVVHLTSELQAHGWPGAREWEEGPLAWPQLVDEG